MKQLTIFIVLILTACSENPMLGAVKPNNLIDKDRMVNILFDLNLIEADLQMKYSHISFYSEAMKKSGDLILSKYGVTQKQFEKSFDYYASRQEEMIAFNNRLLDSLNIESAKLVHATKNKKKQSLLVEESVLKKSIH